MDSGDFSFPSMPNCFLKVLTDNYDPSEIVKLIFGDLSKHLNEFFFFTIEISEIIKFSSRMPWDDVRIDFDKALFKKVKGLGIEK